MNVQSVIEYSRGTIINFVNPHSARFFIAYDGQYIYFDFSLQSTLPSEFPEISNYLLIECILIPSGYLTLYDSSFLTNRIVEKWDTPYPLTILQQNHEVYSRSTFLIRSCGNNEYQVIAYEGIEPEPYNQYKIVERNGNLCCGSSDGECVSVVHSRVHMNRIGKYDDFFNPTHELFFQLIRNDAILTLSWQHIRTSSEKVGTILGRSFLSEVILKHFLPGTHTTTPQTTSKYMTLSSVDSDEKAHISITDETPDEGIDRTGLSNTRNHQPTDQLSILGIPHSSKQYTTSEVTTFFTYSSTSIPNNQCLFGQQLIGTRCYPKNREQMEAHGNYSYCKDRGALISGDQCIVTEDRPVATTRCPPGKAELFIEGQFKCFDTIKDDCSITQDLPEESHKPNDQQEPNTNLDFISLIIIIIVSVIALSVLLYIISKRYKNGE
jgi:hypothetical protein